MQELPRLRQPHFGLHQEDEMAKQPEVPRFDVSPEAEAQLCRKVKTAYLTVFIKSL